MPISYPGIQPNHRTSRTVKLTDSSSGQNRKNYPIQQNCTNADATVKCFLSF